QCAFRNKHGGNNSNVFRRNVVRGFFDCAGLCVYNNTILTNSVGSRIGFYPVRVDTRYSGDVEAVDPGGERRRMNLFHPVFQKDDPLFADPAWRDFRLQRGSPYEGRGAYPANAPLLYVDPKSGDDARDGRSVATAFKTLGRALASVNPGFTIYLLPGQYDEPLNLPVDGVSEQEPLRVRAWGRAGGAVLTAGFAWTGRLHVSLEGLTFTKTGAKLAKCEDVRMAFCVFAKAESALELDRCDDVRLSHLTFAAVERGLTLADCGDVTLTNSLFSAAASTITASASSLPGFYADHNVYDAISAKASRKTANDLDTWRQLTGCEASSRVMPLQLDAAFRPAAGSAVRWAASDLTHAGARAASAAQSLEIAGLRVVPGDGAASFLWDTPRGATEARVTVRPAAGGPEITVEPASTFQVMGEFFDLTSRPSFFFTANRHATVAGLKPGQQYEAVVTALNPERTASHSETIRFSLPAALPPARTFYVSTNGDDAADGATEKTSWRTFARAASGVAPGDKVLVLPGVYRETLRPRVSGAPGRPIVFQSATPGAAVIDLMKSLTAGVEIMNVNHVQVIGFRLAGGAFTMGDNVRVASAAGVRVSGLRVDYPEHCSFEKLRLGHGGLVAVDAPGLVVDNCVFLCGYVGVAAAMSPGARIVNNTILGEGNYGIVVVAGQDGEPYTARNNLFYRVVMGYKTGPNIWVMNAKARLDSDHNLFHIPAKFKSTIGKLPNTDRIQTLAEWQKATGLDAHSLCAEPIFTDPVHGDFRLKPGSPGLTQADDGGAVGAR
ncbi:MAG TPA: hypothetical protein P5137_09540, partial [Candidatus Brocadiia bacterium]|nr:hypothetical protein [Candidatus Brocadiia bacterium]